MTSAASERPFQAIRGLATVAMLKAYYDEGKDHLEMFVPFIVDTVAAMPTDDIRIVDLQELLYQRHGLVMPAHVLHTIMARAARRGIVSRAGGRYHRRGARSKRDLLQERASIEAEHTAIASSFRAFAAEAGAPIGSEEQALALIMRFLEEQHLALILIPDISRAVSRSEGLSRRETTLAARFLRSTIAEVPAHADYVRRMLEGFVLQNTLLLKDLGGIQKKFQNLNVYYDTGILFRALGLCGESARLAVLESFDTLRASDARLYVFEETVSEVERVLHVYRDRLGTSAGIRSLYSTEVSRFVVSHRWKPSDIAVVIATLRARLAQLGVTVRPMPARIPAYTLDEADLSKRLLREGQNDISESRIVHDVNVAAAVLTLRAGKPADSLERANALFATSTKLVARKVREWFLQQGESGLPPVVSEVALTNTAWLRRPASATNLKLHQLVALCSAALQPSRRAWASFVLELQRLESTGLITSDEAALAVVVQLTEDRIADLDEDSEVDADTVADIIERVRETYKGELERARKGLELALAATQADLSIVTSQHQTAIAKAERRAGDLLARRARLEAKVVARAQILAHRGATICFAFAAVLAVAATVLSLPGLFPSGGWPRYVAWPVLLVVGCLGAVDLIWGKHFSGWRQALERLIHRALCRWLLGYVPA